MLSPFPPERGRKDERVFIGYAEDFHRWQRRYGEKRIDHPSGQGVRGRRLPGLNRGFR